MSGNTQILQEQCCIGMISFARSVISGSSEAESFARHELIDFAFQAHPEIPAEGTHARDQYRPHQYGTAGCMEAWFGGRFGQTAQRSRPLQDPATRSGVGEVDRSLASKTIQW